MVEKFIEFCQDHVESSCGWPRFFLVLGIHAIEIMFHMELNQLGRIIQLNKYICNIYV